MSLFGLIVFFGVILGLVIVDIVYIKKQFERTNNLIKEEHSYNVHRAIQLVDTTSDFPIITVNVNNKDVHFLLDTGCDATAIITKKAFKDLEILDAKVCDSKNTIMDCSGNVGKASVSIFDFYIDNTKFTEKFDIVEFDGIDKLNEIYPDLNIVGILGSSFFNKYKWSLDFKELVVWI